MKHLKLERGTTSRHVQHYDQWTGGSECGVGVEETKPFIAIYTGRFWSNFQKHKTQEGVTHKEKLTDLNENHFTDFNTILGKTTLRKQYAYLDDRFLSKFGMKQFVSLPLKILNKEIAYQWDLSRFWRLSQNVSQDWNFVTSLVLNNVKKTCESILNLTKVRIYQMKWRNRMNHLPQTRAV